MPDIRVISWNIKDFSSGRWAKHGNTILDTIYDAANRRYDIFIVIEPLCRLKGYAAGDLIQTGKGFDGILELYWALIAKDVAWKVVPLRISDPGDVADMVGVYYHSGTVDFTGPDVIPLGTAAVTVSPGKQAPWDATTDRAGQIIYHTDATLTTEVDFSGRRPYLVSFNAPAHVERTFAITINAAGTGGLGVATATLPDGIDGRPYLFALQGEGGTAPYTWAEDVGSALPAGVTLKATGELSGTPTANGTFAFKVIVTDSALPAAATATKTINVTIAAAAGGNLAFGTAPNLPDGVTGMPYRVQLCADGGTPGYHFRPAAALPADMTLADDGILTWTTPTAGKTVKVDLSDSLVRGFQILTGHAPPQARAPENSDAIRAFATIREITTLRVIPTAVCGDFNCCPLTTGGCAHVPPESDALNGLTTAGYTSHNGNKRTSLKSTATACKAVYAAAGMMGAGHPVLLDHLTTHAFDHALTHSFPNVASIDTVNLVAEDPSFATAQTTLQTATNPSTAKSPINKIIKKYLWTDGVSDHYPIKFTVTVT